MEEHEKNNLCIENIGAINCANLDIRPLTVIIGPNNSGKSYSAILYHSFTSYKLKLFDFMKNFIGSFIDSDEDLNFYLKQTKFLNDNLEESLIDYLSKMPDMDSEPYIIDKNIINKFLTSMIDYYYADVVSNEIESLLSLKLSELHTFNKKKFNISYKNVSFINSSNRLKIKDQNSDILQSKEFNVSSSKSLSIMKIKVNSEGSISLSINVAMLCNLIFNPTDSISEDIVKKNHRELSRFIINFFERTFLDNIFGYLSSEISYYIPVGKAEILTNLTKIASKSISGNIPPYSYPLRNLTEILIEADYNTKGDFYDLAIKMEEELFHGNIKVNNDLKFPKFSYLRNDGLELSMNSVSSSISEIAPIIILLKYVLKKDETIIIEEPESHLSNDKQTILIKYLVKCINNGLKVMITTHSDSVLDQINNHIRLFINKSPNKKKIMDKYNYSEEDFLDYKKVNVFAFRNIEKEHNSFDANKLNLDDDDKSIDSIDMTMLNHYLFKESEDILELFEELENDS